MRKACAAGRAAAGKAVQKRGGHVLPAPFIQRFGKRFRFPDQCTKIRLRMNTQASAVRDWSTLMMGMVL